MKTRQVVALDLGTSAFKLAVLDLQDSLVRVRQVRVLEVNGQARETSLLSLLQGIPINKASQIVSVVDDPFACVRIVQVPPMPGNELSGAVRWELQRFLAVPPEEMQVDYEAIGEAGSEQNRKLKLVAAAIPSGAVREHLELLERCGVKPMRLIPKAAAVSAWAGRFQTGKGPVAVLEFGKTGSEFIVADSGRPIFTRKIPVGGADLTRSMTNVLMTAQGQTGLTELEAETLKRSTGIPGDDAPETLTKGISRTQIVSLIRGTLEKLAVEVENSLTFYGESSAGTGIEELLLVGGGAHLKGLVPWLEQRLGVRVSAPDPFKGMGLIPKALPENVSAVSLSLVSVLGAGMDAGAGLNLLPKELKEASRLRIQRAASLGTLTALALGLTLFWVGLQVYRHSLSRQVEALKLERTAVERMLPLARATVNVQELLAREPEWRELFRRLSVLVPSDVYLEELRIDGKTVFLRGKIRRATASPDETLARFMQQLRESLLGDLRLGLSRRLEESSAAAEFEMAGVLP